MIKDIQWLYKSIKELPSVYLGFSVLKNKGEFGVPKDEVLRLINQLDDYTEEEEQKYILSINITDKATKTNYETFLNKRGIFHSMENDSFNSEEFNWSEEEIRGLTKGDILFEHFAVKLEELEKCMK